MGVENFWLAEQQFPDDQSSSSKPRGAMMQLSDDDMKKKEKILPRTANGYAGVCT